MRFRMLLLMAATLVPCWYLAAAQPKTNDPQTPAVEQPLRDIQDLVYFGETRPVFIRLHVQVDGKPMRAAWADFIRQLFKYLDGDGDGVLNKLEIARVPPPQSLMTTQFFTSPGRANPAALDFEGKGKTTLEELAHYYRQNGASAFQAQMGYSMAAAADALTKVLFEKLDTNKDTSLSKEELAKAAELLLRLDQDDDEVVTAGEVVPNPQILRRGGVPRGEMTAGGMPTDGVFFVIDPTEGSERLTKQLQTRYGDQDSRIRDRKVKRDEIGLDDATFDELDRNKDNKLDESELGRFTLRTPDMELNVRLGKRADGEAMIDIANTKTLFAANVHRSADGNAVLEIGNTRLAMRTADSPSGRPAQQFDVRQYYLQQFKAADTDSNAYLEQKEAQRGVFRDIFNLVDRDGDGKLFEKEVTEYVGQIQEIQTKALAARVSMIVADQGNGLFQMLDGNGDGRLSIRELRNAPHTLRTMDLDKDDQVSSSEIPRSYHLILAQGLGNPNQPTQPVRSQVGPLWFRKMDRNGDGDVSLREFLGTEEEFKKLDLDADGLIGLAEAEKADEELRKRKEASKSEDKP